MLLGDVRITADDKVQLIDVDGSVQCTLTVEDALTLLHQLLQQQHLLLYRYSQQQAKERKNKEAS